MGKKGMRRKKSLVYLLMTAQKTMVTIKVTMVVTVRHAAMKVTMAMVMTDAVVSVAVVYSTMWAD